MKTTDTAWSPTPRRYTPADLEGAPRTGPAPDYPALAVAVLDSYPPNAWDLHPAVWAVEETSDGLWAVLVPYLDISGKTSAYHQMACLDLTAFHGAMVVQEGRTPSVRRGRGDEMRFVLFASADGTGGSRVRVRSTGQTVAPDDFGGYLYDFLAAVVGRKFHIPMPPNCVKDLVVWAVAGQFSDGPPLGWGEDLSDAEFVAAFDLSDGFPGHLVADTLTEMAGCLADVVPSLGEPGVRRIAMTGELIDWLGEDFFRLGVAQPLPSAYLVRASWAVMRVGDLDDAQGAAVRRRLARVMPEAVPAETPDETDLARLGAAIAVSEVLFSDGFVDVLGTGTPPGTGPAMRKFQRALRALVYDCDPQRPDVPLLARRVGVLADAAAGKFAAAA